ncbi:class I SAM-dependent methyltransferase [Massilia oculi]|uniref:Class I SAM-dependent methyltransferase n=1 Tax=Massilia hydrophila TaxID=3044279 RepID=A0ABS7YGB4_9BURK|nr:class I SAM-dependent methyltransferase [Massilia oculi]MCA1857375.1 class I SAM-dependent methyltransferase [Massilia oculi]
MNNKANIPSWSQLGRHAMLPEASHDEVARFDLLAQMNVFLSQQLAPGVRLSYEKRTLPAFVAEHGREPADRHEIRRAMQKDPAFQFWSALRRNAMEQRQQAGRSLVFRQLGRLVAAAERINRDKPTLRLDPSVTPPRYATAVDIHCMPGGYHTEVVEGDVSAAANYDAGIFVTTAGMLGSYSDGGGQAIVQWLAANRPGFRPRRILDIGCTVGHNVVPLALAFPDAEVVAVDVSAPMLRYAHARAQSLGAHNLSFVQANGEALDYPDEHFDLITTAMFWHETSSSALPRILAEIQRLLAPGGITLHLEQPQYPGMDLYEQFIRDWDTYNNNEPFWTVMHDLDLRQVLANAGFAPERYFETTMAALVDRSIFPQAGEGQQDYGRTAAWTAFGTSKPSREEQHAAH